MALGDDGSAPNKHFVGSPTSPLRKPNTIFLIHVVTNVPVVENDDALVEENDVVLVWQHNLSLSVQCICRSPLLTLSSFKIGVMGNLGVFANAVALGFSDPRFTFVRLSLTRA